MRNREQMAIERKKTDMLLEALGIPNKGTFHVRAPVRCESCGQTVEQEQEAAWVVTGKCNECQDEELPPDYDTEATEGYREH